MESRLKQILTICAGAAALVGLYHALLFALAGYPQSVAVSVAQFSCFPLLVWLAARGLPSGLRPPALLLVLVLTAAAAGGAFEYAWQERDARFAVARLAGDELESETRILREKLDALLGRLGAPRSVRYLEAFQEAAAVRAWLRAHPRNPGVLWGGRKLLTLSLQIQEPAALGDLPGGAALPEAAAALRLVRSVPAVGLGFAPAQSSLEFIGTLMAGLSQLERPSSGRIADAEALFRSAATTFAGWSSYTHLAFPWLLVGNLHLAAGLKDGFHPVEIQCALKAYQRGLSLLQCRNHPELCAALHNNRAVGLELQRLMERRPRARKAVRKGFIYAWKARRMPNPYAEPYLAAAAAAANLQVWRRGEPAPQRRKHRVRKARGQPANLHEREDTCLMIESLNCS